MRGDAPILLARGRRADVVRVTDEHDRTRVLKLVRGGLDRARVEDAMTREFELLRCLRARGVVGCLGLESDGESWALHFEDTGATSLDLRPGRVSPDDAARIAIDLARTLVDLHAEDVLHLAIDPSHVLVVPGGQTRLVGFGDAVRFACVHRPRGWSAPQTPFVAPELAGTISMPIDARTDLFALGATITWMLAGAHRAGEDADRLAEVARWLASPHPDDRPESAEQALACLLGERAPLEARAPGPSLGHAANTLILVDASPGAFDAHVARLALSASARGEVLHRGLCADRRAEAGLADPDASLARLERATGAPTCLALDGIDATDDRLFAAIARRVRAPAAGPLMVLLARTEGDGEYVARLERTFANHTRVEHARLAEDVPDLAPISAAATRILALLAAAQCDVEVTLLETLTAGDARAALREAARAGHARIVLGSDRARITASGLAYANARGDVVSRARDAHALFRVLEPHEPRAHRLARVAARAVAVLEHDPDRQHVAMLLVDAIETTTLGEAYTACAQFGVALLALLDGDERRAAKTSIRRALAEAARAAVSSDDSLLAERLLGAVAAIAKEPLDVGEVHTLRAIAAFERDDEVTALVEAHAAARALGFSFPMNVTPLRAAMETTALAPTLLLRDGDVYATLDTTEGLANVLVHDLLHAALESARRLPPALASSLAAATLRESLSRGGSPATVLALAHVAISVLDRAPALARSAAKAALALSRRFRDVEARARANIVYALALSDEPSSARLARIRHARDEAIREGLDVIAVDATIAAVRTLARSGEELEALGEELRDGARALGRMDPSIGALLQSIENLVRDDGHTPWIHRGPTFEEGNVVEALEHGDRTTAARAIASQLVLAGLFERVETAERLNAALRLLGEDERAARDVPGFVLHTTLASLTAATPIIPRTRTLVSLFGEAAFDARRRGTARLALAEWLDRLGADELALGMRETLVRDGRLDGGRTGTLERAVFAERLARAYGRHGDAASAENALREAHALYAKSGAMAKVRALEAAHPWLAIS